MSTGDCRVDYIRDYSFSHESIIQVDQQSNLETINSCSFLHVTSLTLDLLSLIVDKCQLIQSLQFDSIVGDLKNVWSLNYDNCSTNFQEKSSLPKLDGLKMLICPSNIDEINLSLLLANCPNLETLIICFAREGETNYGISGNCFNYLGSKIKHLILGNLSVNVETIDHLLNSNGSKIIEIEILFPLRESTFNRVLELSNLRKLTFKACYCFFEQIIEISKFSNLESLEIERMECRFMTLEELFSSVFQKCRKLKQFKVSGVFQLYSHRFIEMIVENNLQLTHLHILPNMYKSDVYRYKITISTAIKSLCSLKQLQSLSLPYSDFNDDHLKTILNHCYNLTSIDLSYCPLITSVNNIITHAQQNQHKNYSIILQSTKIKTLPQLPKNLKLCICNNQNGLPLHPTPFYDLI